MKNGFPNGPHVVLKDPKKFIEFKGCFVDGFREGKCFLIEEGKEFFVSYFKGIELKRERTFPGLRTMITGIIKNRFKCYYNGYF